MATSPYLIREARRLKIDTPAAAEPLPGAASEHRPNDYRFARTQREAGIEELEWEDRITPMRPLIFWLIVTACWAIPVGVIASVM